MRTSTQPTLIHLLIILALVLPAGAAAAQAPGDPTPPLAGESPAATYKFYLPAINNRTCSQLIQNGGFEQDNGWIFVASSRPASYTTAAHHSGARALQVGIRNPAQVLDSRAEAYQDVYIPSGVAHAILSFWLYPMANITSAPELEGQQPPEAIQPAPEDVQPEPEIGSAWTEAVLVADTQYVVILDTNGVLLNTLVWWQTSNSRAWTNLEFDLAQYAGKTVRVLFGAYNNSSLGTAVMYADDVTLNACPTSVCTNLFGNSGFEGSGSWNIPITAYSAAYSTERKYAGGRSMRTGITGDINKYSYSDAYQVVTIPSNATQASLRLWYYPQSGEVANAPEAEDRPALNPPQPGVVWDDLITQTAPTAESLNSPDAQYVLLLNQNGAVLKTLLWTLRNTQAWTYFTYDLTAYRGQTVRIQFGTMNDGYGGKTAMFVDEAYLDNCSGGSQPPPPPPPPNCGEKLTNGNFESSTGWVIPVTEYSAGYSTVRYHSYARSMRTGIVYSYDNTYSYSDFSQKFSLPSSLSSAELRVWFFPMSGEAAMTAIPAIPQGQTFGEAPLASDVQYLLVLDTYGNWIGTEYWDRTNQQSWLYRTFDLSGYAGRTIQLQFGSYNDGYNGVTALYVDDASLWVCP
jgi:hypothetical protein